MKKIIPILVLSILIVGVGAFYGGMKYQQSKGSPGNFFGQNFQNMSAEQRQQFAQGNASGSFRQGAGRMVGSGFLSGQVISKDEQSLTLKMQDGSSKIVFFSDATKISKTTEGTVSDISQGDEITIIGQQNSDGSYTAQTIQQGNAFPRTQ